MSFKYSICYPDRENIDYKNTPITKEEVLDIAKNYPWEEQLKVKGENYNPSLDFINIENKKSFCLTANFDNNHNIEFSLWFNRPKKVKIFFGLFGEKEKMIVDDVWSIQLEDSIKFLEFFVNENYKDLERLYK
ncbi:MAG: hypothetical protein V3V28_13115 [Polaribacter sp.]|uniref:hypothetical protein n=1 Tax=Polaribacter sp. TaxID=1920175 RepID=UPI002F34F84C